MVNPQEQSFKKHFQITSAYVNFSVFFFFFLVSLLTCFFSGPHERFHLWFLGRTSNLIKRHLCGYPDREKLKLEIPWKLVLEHVFVMRMKKNINIFAPGKLCNFLIALQVHGDSGSSCRIIHLLRCNIHKEDTQRESDRFRTFNLKQHFRTNLIDPRGKFPEKTGIFIDMSGILEGRRVIPVNITNSEGESRAKGFGNVLKLSIFDETKFGRETEALATFP